MTYIEKKIPNNQNEQKHSFVDFDYTELLGKQEPKDSLITIFIEKNFFNRDFTQGDFEGFIDNLFIANNLDEDLLLATKYKNNKFYIYFSDGTNIKFEYKDIKTFLLKNVLKTEKKEDIEERVKDLNNALEAIYDENDGIIFTGEVNDEDIITNDLIEDYDLDKNLKGKNLNQLKDLLDKENSKLFKIYDITGETHKKQDLLKKEIKFYAGIGDKYEGAAGYFRLSSSEIQEKVSRLCSTMSISEVMNYIKILNKDIDSNFRRSDMVEQVNLKLINILYVYTFDRLKKENSLNKEFVNFIKLITGRGKLKLDKDINYKNQQEFEYNSLDITDSFRNQMLANEVLIYIMYKEGGLLEEIEKEDNGIDKIELEDDELDGKTPGTILSEASVFFNKTVGNKIPGYGKKILNNLGFSNELNKPYNDLDFNEKVKIGALARIIKEIGDLDETDLMSQQKIQELSKKLTEKAFNDLNESLSDNFNETLSDWNGTSAEDLGLKGLKAEIFELYQDINGNRGAFDWKDDNELGLGSIVFGISMIAGIYILGPILTGKVAYSFLTASKAGALMGLARGSASQIFSHKGYDTYTEGAIDVISQIAIETALSSLFTASGLGYLKKMGVTLNPDLLFSLKAWSTKAGLIDKGFILGEVLATMFASLKVSSTVKQSFIKNHSDTDKKRFTRK